ncbi:MAG: hypothetical protein EXR70_01575 [Deltaproteobacteria bacterium]|nr:hypothetical protein [Deltaproteobacteria bacterium]
MIKNNLKPLALSAMMALSVTVGAGHAKANESGVISKQANADGTYCHIKYMAFTAESLRNGSLEFEPSDVIDSYGPCDFDPKSQQEVRKQLAASSRGIHGDGSSSGDSGD